MKKGGDGTNCMEKGVQYSWQDPGPGASSIAVDMEMLIGGDGILTTMRQ